MGSRVSFRIAGFVLAVLGSVALVPIGGDSSPPDFGQPLRGLTAEQLERFEEGREEFEEVETAEEGLGPVFNDAACASCHTDPAVGGGSTRLETRFGTLTPARLFDPLTQFGGSLIQEQGIGSNGGCDFQGEKVPPEATIVAGRRTTPLFGLGLVDAVPELTFRRLAYSQKYDRDGIAGLLSIVTNLSTGRREMGKFGWKAQNPTLFQFAGDAYLNEGGITNPDFAIENCPQGDCGMLRCNPFKGLNDDGSGVVGFTDFMTFLAPPPRGRVTWAAAYGERIFNNLGCASCHVSTLRTGSNEVDALDRVTFHPYSDFLLHDMGSLGDGITQNRATGRLMRTAPLWGVRKQTLLLHDGRATSLEKAILAHDGQGRRARDRYLRLHRYERTRLMAFLNSL